MTSQQITVPSQEFWTITPFHVTAPEGWAARQTVDQLVYMEADGEPGTNCGIQWKRVSAKLKMRQIAQMSHAVTRRIDPDVKVGVSRHGALHGRPTFLRISEFDVSEQGGDAVRRVGQVYAAFFGPRFTADSPVELFEIIGHFPAGDEAAVAAISGVVESFRFNIRLHRVDNVNTESKGA